MTLSSSAAHCALESGSKIWEVIDFFGSRIEVLEGRREKNVSGERRTMEAWGGTTYGMLWSTVTSVQSGLRTARPAVRLRREAGEQQAQHRPVESSRWEDSQSLERLRRGDLMDEMTVDVDDGVSGALVDEVVVPDLVDWQGGERRAEGATDQPPSSYATSLQASRRLEVLQAHQGSTIFRR